jgi:lipopolysaccharide/colanic/teichoic acid biosynthesis glycosyltransferase
VLRGRMSLVGPRPLRMDYLGRYSPGQARRHLVKPGVTGLAQVSGRERLGWEQRFDLDVQYVATCSFTGDLRILWQTVKRLLADVEPAEGALVTEFVGGAS